VPFSSRWRDQLGLDTDFVVWHGDFEAPPDTDIVVNATPLGLYDAGARIALALSALTPRMVVADVVFNPPRTRLIRDADARGCRTLDGLGMIVNQGVISIEHWTGISPDPVVMRRAVEQALGLSRVGEKDEG
jgi:shikimate dehydrogenase